MPPVIVLVLLVTLNAQPLLAQPVSQTATDLTIDGVGVISFQPTDPTYNFSPYLESGGLGGVAPGLGLGLTVRHQWFVGGAEVSTAALDRTMSGRTVTGPDPGEAHGHLRDTFLTGLVGVTLKMASARVDLLAGASRAFGGPTLDGVSVSDADSPLIAGREGAGRGALTTGGNFRKAFSRRWGLQAVFRYYDLARSRWAHQIGVGEKIFRVGLGASFRL